MRPVDTAINRRAHEIMRQQYDRLRDEVAAIAADARDRGLTEAEVIRLVEGYRKSPAHD